MPQKPLKVSDKNFLFRKNEDLLKGEKIFYHVWVDKIQNNEICNIVKHNIICLFDVFIEIKGIFVLEVTLLVSIFEGNLERLERKLKNFEST